MTAPSHAFGTMEKFSAVDKMGLRPTTLDENGSFRREARGPVDVDDPRRMVTVPRSLVLWWLRTPSSRLTRA